LFDETLLNLTVTKLSSNCFSNCICTNQVFKGDLRTRFGSLELKIRSLQSEKIIIGSLESEKSGLYRAIPGTSHFL